MAGHAEDPDTLVRGLHDLGLAAWFGGSLAGAVAVNGAVADVPDPKLRLQVVNTGWARWAPVNAAAIAAHLTGSAGLLQANAAVAPRKAIVRRHRILVVKHVVPNAKPVRDRRRDAAEHVSPPRCWLSRRSGRGRCRPWRSARCVGQRLRDGLRGQFDEADDEY